jgi:hypothetical protein
MHARKHCDRLRCPPDHSKGTFQQKKKKIGQKKKKKMPQNARGGPEHHGNAFSDVVSGPKCPNFAVSA